jgi:hypothetical protein
MRSHSSARRMPGPAESTHSRLLPLLFAFVLVVAVQVSAAPGGPGVADAARLRARHCGSIPVEDEFHPKVRVSASHISCRKARRIITAYLDGSADEQELVGSDDYNGYVRLKHFPGWRCTSGAGAGGCRKGRREAGWDWFFN